MLSLPASIAQELRRPYALSADQIAFYDQNRFIKLKAVLSAEAVAFFREVIHEKVNEMNTVATALEERSTYGKAFLQLFNLWRESPLIRELVFSPRIAGIAAGLMQTAGARLYHDQALFKEPGGGITPWHADQHYWPLATDKTITAWIPLQATPLNMGPLEFSAGSHRLLEGRQMGISDASEQAIGQNLRINDFPHVAEPFDLGEVSFHSGWVFHRAGANQSAEMRRVMTVIYMDKDMRLKAPDNDSQRNDWAAWCPGAVPGEIIDTPLNPVLYPAVV